MTAPLPVAVAIDYDAQAGVLYLSYRKRQQATDAELRDDGIIVHTRQGELVGLTILDVLKRSS